jgi:hypothetical protein
MKQTNYLYDFEAGTYVPENKQMEAVYSFMHDFESNLYILDFKDLAYVLDFNPDTGEIRGGIDRDDLEVTVETLMSNMHDIVQLFKKLQHDVGECPTVRLEVEDL